MSYQACCKPVLPLRVRKVFEASVREGSIRWLRRSNHHTSHFSTIHQYFSALATERRLEQATAILQTAAGDEETVIEVAWETWKYVEANRLWQDSFETLKAFKDDIGYDRAHSV